MSDADPSQSSAGGLPRNLVMLGLAAIILMLAVSIFLTWTVSRQIQTIVSSQSQVLTEAERVEHYGSVLELSVKAVVATGDAEAAARYRVVQPRLRQTITALRDELQLRSNKIVAEVDRTDLELVAMEYEALELAGRGRLPEARAIIHSDRYEGLVKVYFDGVHKIEDQASQYLEQSKRSIASYLTALLVLCLGSFAFLLIAWLAVARRARTWAGELQRERQKAEHALASLLESQVQLEQADQKLFEQARIDPLTALPSRRKFNEDVEVILADVSGRGESYSLVMCDVDHFKQYNDTYGHPAGDEVLRAIGEAFTRVSRAGDQVYRYGGEEFVLILRTISLEAGMVCADRYRAAVELMRITQRGSASGYVTVSMGVAQVDPERPLSAERWIERADVALYEAKRRGRNQVGSGKLAAA